MKEPDWAHCTEEQLWKYVATHLAKNGIDTVLVGGAVVAVYTDGAYRSGDLDFVQISYCLVRAGVTEKGRFSEIGFGSA